MRLQFPYRGVFIVLFSCWPSLQPALAQPNFSTASTMDSVYGLSIEDLMRLTIVTASREEEDYFDSPVSTFVITASDIENSGILSIPGALRLCPGLIVREVANGSFDISIRGGADGFQAYTFSYANTKILALIDNRPVFNSLQGGVFWQNLGIPISEVARLEIVLGPMAPLYGPNAVSGVINIITKHPDARQPLIYSASGIGGEFTNQISGFYGAQINEKVGVSLGLSYDRRTLFDPNFYDYTQDAYVPLDSFNSSTVVNEKLIRFPDPERSVEMVNGTWNIHYQPSESVEIRLGTSFNRNTTLDVLSAGTQLSSHDNTSQSLDLTGRIDRFSFQANLLNGTQGLSGNLTRNKYDYTNSNFYLDYTFTTLDQSWKIKPALSYQVASVDDRKYTTDVGLSGNFNGQGSVNNWAGSLSCDGRIFKKFRVILAGRLDRFNFPKKSFFSYQAIVNYAPKKHHLLRWVSGRSYNGSFVSPTLINIRNQITPTLSTTLSGNKDLNLLSNTVIELGYRTRIADQWSADVALFHQSYQDFFALILQSPTFDPLTSSTNLPYLYENLPLRVRQIGVTLSLQGKLFEEKVLLRPHLTWTNSHAENYSPNDNVEGAWDNPATGYQLDGHKDKTTDLKSPFTPDWFGGINITYFPTRKLTLNLQNYFFDSYELTSLSQRSLFDGSLTPLPKPGTIQRKVLINATARMNVAKGFYANFTINNLLNQTSHEGFGSAKMGRMFLLGLTLRN